MEKQLNHIALRYRSLDTNRPAMQHVHRDGDVVVATDAHALLIAPIGRFEPTPEPYAGKWPDWKPIVPEATIVPIYTVSAKDILAKYPKEREQPIFEDCPTCEGIGTKECECCGHDWPCDNCNGRATTNTIIGKEIDYRDAISEIYGVLFSWNYLKLIADTAQWIGVDEIRCHASAPLGANLFKMDDICVVLMPLRNNEMEAEIIKVKHSQATPTTSK